MHSLVNPPKSLMTFLSSIHLKDKTINSICYKMLRLQHVKLELEVQQCAAPISALAGLTEQASHPSTGDVHAFLSLAAD